MHCFKWMSVFLALALVLSMTSDATAAQRRRRARAYKKPAAKTMVPGMWGGPHIAMQVTAAGAEVEFDCAHGTIEQPIRLDINGRFNVPGTFVAEGGPVSVPVDTGARSPQKVLNARYQGRVEGKKLILTVLIDSGQPSDPFSLTHDNPSGLTKCY